MARVRARGAEQMGTVRFSHGRFVFGPCRLYRHEDGHLRFVQDGPCGQPVAQPGAAGGVPQRCGDGAGGRGARPARHFVVVRGVELLRRYGGSAETGGDDHDDADFRYGRLHPGVVRPCGRRYLHQGGRCGCRPGGEGRSGYPGRRSAQSGHDSRQRGR